MKRVTAGIPAAVLAAAMAVTPLLGATTARAADPTGAPGDTGVVVVPPPAEAVPDSSVQEVWARARSLSDEGRFNEARDVVDEGLRQYPDNVDLLWLRAGIEGWSGNHDRAVALYEQLGVDHPEVKDGVAPDLANERALAQRAAEEALRPPHVETLFSWRDDNEDGRFVYTAATYYRPLHHRDVLLLYLAADRVRDPASEHTFARIGAGYERDWTDQWVTHVLVHMATGDEEGVPFLLGDAFVVYRMSPRYRFDYGVSRETLDSAEALRFGVHMWATGLGADLGLAERTDLRAAARVYLYSDDNVSYRQSVEVRHRLITDTPRLQWTLFARAEALEAREQLDHGYYDPEAYIEVGPGFEVRYLIRPAWPVDLRLQLGRQKERDANADLFTSMNAGIEFPLARYVSLGLRVFRGDSGFGSDSGYEQRGWSILLITGR